MKWFTRHRGFRLLAEELDRWSRSATPCSLWWRDDDLVRNSANLQRLQRTADAHGLEILVAVIPEQAERRLGEETSSMGQLVFCQHGLQHLSHESDTAEKSEFGPGRGLAAIRRDLETGFAICREIFGERFFPVLVPPWNNFHLEAIPVLAEVGFLGLSRYGFLTAVDGADITFADTHIDLIDWQRLPGPGVLPQEEMDIRFAEVLRQRRTSNQWLHTPTGILTHHRVMGDGDWKALDELLDTLGSFPCVQWLSPREIFHQDPVKPGLPPLGRDDVSTRPCCNICGGEEFGPGPNGRMAVNGNLPHCLHCGSLERHRILRGLFMALPRDFLGWRRALQFSPDTGLDPAWFLRHEISIYGEENSLDIRAIDRPDGSYDFISLNHVMEFIREDRLGFKELIRVLSPRGVLQICFSEPLSRDLCQDFAEPQGPFQAWHLFGKDLDRRFRCAEQALGVLAIVGTDPCTGVSEIVHLFLRDASEAAKLRAILAEHRIQVMD